MTTVIDNKLIKLQDDMARKKRIEVLLKELNIQKEELEKKVIDLDRIKVKEESDVEKIEGLSLQSLVYSVMGKKKEKLSKEKKEAYAAVAKFDLASRELDRILDYIAELEYELKCLKDCESEYEKSINKKIVLIKLHNKEKAKEFVEYENRYIQLEKNVIEIEEAIQASNKAVDKINQVIKCLDSAIQYSEIDMSNPRLEISMVKHEELDKAHRLIKSLHFNLVKVKAELKDVDVYSVTNMNVKINSYLKFADFFLDGLFIDITIHQHINEVITEVNNMKDEISVIINSLKDRKRENENEIISLKNKIETLAKMC
jgi:tetratricopeptide (TPR) repeat protein